MANERARRLRRNATEEERILWSQMRKGRLESFKFCRQHPMGRFVIDFVCLERRLVVEIDGFQHGLPAYEAGDLLRTRWLEESGYRVVRFWNSDIRRQLDNVLETILGELSERASLRDPTPALPHQGGGSDEGDVQHWVRRVGASYRQARR
jgi:very-short-patch-repair endonuclease